MPKVGGLISVLARVGISWPIGLVLLLSLLTVWPLFSSGYFSHHDDLQVMRIFEMRRCLLDGQIPCRWVPDMGYGNGFPMFNYYGVLPYYLGALVSFVTSYLLAAKFLFLVVLIGGGVTMYLLAAEIFGVGPGLAASVLYLFAPYRAVDSYVRGAIAESFALMLIPLVLYFLLRLIKNGRIADLAGVSLSVAGFLMSHNIMTIIFLPVVALWAGLWLWMNKWQHQKLVIKALVLGFGLAASFVLPAYLEKSLVQTENLTRADLDFRAHFATVKQLFVNRSWGYGASVPGPFDGLSFQIGWPHWWLVVAAAVGFWQARRVKRLSLLVLLMGVFGVSVVMMHNQSAPVWEQLKILQYAQFPWRFLSLSIFSASLLGGLALSLLPSRWRWQAVGLVIVVTVVLNANYFQPQTYDYALTDQQKLSGKLWEEQQKAGIMDYLPKTAVESREPAPDHPLITKGQAEIKSYYLKSNKWGFDARVEKEAVLEMPVYDFAGWQVEVDEKRVGYNHDNYLGRIQFNLPIGEHQVRGRFTDTAVRTWSNIISLTCILGLVILIRHGKNRATSR